MTKNEGNVGNVASPEEAAAELTAMNKTDMVRLEQFARLRTAGFAWLNWEDLLHEAIDRVLTGSRRWPKSIPFIVFMLGTIRSIANEFWRSRTTKAEITAADLPSFSHDTESLLDVVVDERANPERDAMAKQVLKKINDLFAGDRNAVGILKGLADGSTPAEIQQDEGMTATQYATVQKRIRRTLSRALREERL